MRPRAVLLDVIGTLFPLAPLDAPFAALGLPGGREAWFAASLREAFALAATGRYAKLPEIMAAMLDDLLAREGIAAPASARQAVADTFAALPPHPEALPALARLRDAGVRLVAISNGTLAGTRGLLERGGLAPLLDAIRSTEEVGLSKPRPEVYAAGLASAGVAAGETAMLAAHPWDLAGAAHAGLRTAWVRRGRPWPGYLAPPDVVADELGAAAAALLEA